MEEFDPILIMIARSFKMPDLAMDYKDVAQILRIRLWKQHHLYDPSKPYKPWATRVCKRYCYNIYRDNCTRKKRLVNVNTVSINGMNI